MESDAFALLKNELLNDPSGVGYAGKSDGDVLALFHKELPMELIQGDIPPAQTMLYILSIGKWLAVKQVDEGFADYLRSGHNEPMGIEWVTTILDNLNAAGVLSDTQKDSILALGQSTPHRSRFDAVLYGNVVTPADVRLARQ